MASQYIIGHLIGWRLCTVTTSIAVHQNYKSARVEQKRLTNLIPIGEFRLFALSPAKVKRKGEI